MKPTQFRRYIFLSLFSFLSMTGRNAYSGANFRQPVPEDSLTVRPAKVRIYNTERLSTVRPVIDGKLDDDCWKTGTWEDNYVQYIPNEGGKPSYKTELKILYDDKNIYVAIRAYDAEPDKIHRYAGLRDDFAGDIVGVNFDSYHDHRTGFEFDLTAYGQKIDLILTNPYNWDVSWNPVWYGKVGKEDSAWTTEMEIPLNQLRYSNEDEQVWGMHSWRWIDRLQEESDWEPLTKTGAGIMYQFGEIHGIKGLKKSRRLEIMPYALGQLNTYRPEPSNPYIGNGKVLGGNAGLDAKIGLTSNFTVDLTVNPDFGQVESDPSVLNLTAFETFYEEKRPFFLEGKTIFEYDFDDINLFYSRRLGHAPSLRIDPATGLYVKAPDKTAILSAAKLSGKTADGLSVGVLQSITAGEKARITDEFGNETRQTVEPLTSYTVARLQKDYHEGNTVIGGIFTSTNRFIHDDALSFLAQNAYTGGLDFLHQWNNKKYFIDMRLVGSNVTGDKKAMTLLQESSARYFQRPGADYLHFDTTRTQLNGYGGKFKIGKGTGKLQYTTELRWISPGLELNDIGYMQSADVIEQMNEVKFIMNHPVSIFNTYQVNLEQFNDWNFNSTFIRSGSHISFESQFKNLWQLSLNLIGHTGVNDTQILRGGYEMKMPFGIMTFDQISTDPARKVAFSFEYEMTRKGYNSLSSYSFSPGFRVRPVNTLRIAITGNYATNHDLLQYVTTSQTSLGTRYIMGSLNQRTLGFTFRIDYSITPEFSIQYYGSPFVSRGTYSDFKHITDPVADKFEDRFSIYKNLLRSEGTVYLDENSDKVYDYEIADPDFNFHQFRSNFVAKWEYRPGSLIYLVWSADRTGNLFPPSQGLGNSFNTLWDRFPDSIFLVKFSYWFSL